MQAIPPSPPLQIDAMPCPARNWTWEKGRAHTVAINLARGVQIAAQNGKRTQPILRNYLRHPQARLSASLKALGGTPSEEEATTLRERVSAWRAEYDPIRWRYKEKTNGGTRIICSLPLELKAAHYLLKRPLEFLSAPDANIFGVCGRSRDDLAREINQLQNRGYRYTATLDVIDCYQSVDPNALYSLPIPKEVIQRTLDLRYLELEETHRTKVHCNTGSASYSYDTTHKASGPKGLMQGSPISGIILAWLLNGIPTQKNARVFLCFDNLIVLARTPSETRAMVHTLAAHFRQCPAGSLALCEPEFADNTPIEFLGYRFDPDEHDIGIGEAGHRKLIKRLVKAEDQQEKICNHIWSEHEKLRENSLIARENPLINQFPTGVWEVLLSFRAGFPAVSPSAADLKFYLETSRWMAERTGNVWATHLHDRLFADSSADEARMIHKILSNRKNQLEECSETVGCATNCSGND